MERARERRIQTICLLILSALAVGAALLWLRAVMIPFVVAVFFAIGLSPLVDLQTDRLKLPRLLAVIVTLILGFALIAALGALISASVSQLAANSHLYQQQLTRLLADLVARLPEEIFGQTREALLKPLTEVPVSSIGRMLLGTTNAILEIFSRGLLVLIFLVFLLLGRDGVPLPADSTWFQVESRIKRYLVTKVLVSAVTGVLVGGVLSLLGVSLALVFGLFAFLLNFIPSIGSIIATLLPVPVVIASPDLSGGAAVAAIAIPGLIQFSVGNVIEPRIMGESLDLHPVTILLNLILWGALWGVVGMLLGTPLLAVMKMFFERLEPTRPVAELMAGRLVAPAPADKPAP